MWEDLIIQYVCTSVAIFWLFSILCFLSLGTTKERSQMAVCVILLISILVFRIGLYSKL